MIGHISLTLSEERNSAFVGYTLNKRYWNNGYTTEALEEVVNLSFNTLNLSELEADFISDNIGSQKVLEKNGFTILNRIEQRPSLRGQLVDYSNAKLLNKDIIV